MSQQTEARELAPAAIDRKMAIEAAAKAARHAYWRPGFPHDDWERAPDITKQKWIDVANAALRAAPPAPVGGVDERCAFEAFCRSYFAGESPTSKGLTLNAQNRRVKDCQSAWSAALAWKSASLTNEGGREWEPPALMQNGDTKRDPELRKRLDRWSKEQNKKVATVIDRIFGEPPAINEGGSEPVRRFDLDADGSMDEFPDGRWVRYEDHCKAAAPLPSAKALTFDKWFDDTSGFTSHDEGVARAAWNSALDSIVKTTVKDGALSDERIIAIAADFDLQYPDTDIVSFARALLAAQQPKTALTLPERRSRTFYADELAGVEFDNGWNACLDAIQALAEQPSEDKRDTPAARDVLAERRRQVESEGWTPEHDDEHDEGELSLAAAGYAQSASDQIQCVAKELDDSTLEDDGCPSPNFPHGWQFKAAPPRRMLVKAGALILAEIDRMDRAAIAKGEGK